MNPKSCGRHDLLYIITVWYTDSCVVHDPKSIVLCENSISELVTVADTMNGTGLV